MNRRASSFRGAASRAPVVTGRPPRRSVSRRSACIAVLRTRVCSLLHFGPHALDVLGPGKVDSLAPIMASVAPIMASVARCRKPCPGDDRQTAMKECIEEGSVYSCSFRSHSSWRALSSRGSKPCPGDDRHEGANRQTNRHEGANQGGQRIPVFPEPRCALCHILDIMPWIHLVRERLFRSRSSGWPPSFRAATTRALVTTDKPLQRSVLKRSA